ncbi:SDR family NAD(P)-dependent oxidoreductase [Sphingomonas sp. PAMC26645]|uniref:SDR family NAD(P)-dependent oxidoreductase n=1 Tax=Sphingomonas sp. PAMC26645 TaxID=2565555 RepID=UPI00109E0780|nr:SDR family NAD(P)-dependent oxidoreductase [Sphingomonas sp. PAMC26645]QCB43662.1 SDR family NAD(P)-dependent oxidoreductase [Sphingomonas sp. PAMC26645]
MSRRMTIAGTTAIVTGAASGIGRAVAVSLARRGCTLILVDLDMAGLEETKLLLPGVTVVLHQLDLGNGDAITAFGARVAADHPVIDILVNNAGVALGGTFEQLSPSMFEWLFAINFWGVVRMTRTILPLLHRSADAGLVNVSSLFGLIAPPGQSAYAASKFAVRGFSEALRHELKDTTIGVTVVHPGGVATAIATSARPAASMTDADRGSDLEKAAHLLRLQPERAGELIVEAIIRRQPRLLIGADAKIASVIERLMPVSYWTLLARGKGPQPHRAMNDVALKAG